MVDDADFIVRMVWHPCHFDGDSLKTSAFESDDLVPENDENGQPRYLSADKLNGIRQDSVDWRVAFQQREGRDERLGREKPRFVEFLCGEVRGAVDAAGQNIFDVPYAPTAAGDDGEGSPDNPAHCGIASITPAPVAKKDKRQKVANLRTQLLKIKRRIIHYDSLFLL